MPATRIDISAYDPTGYHAVVLPYVVSGPNSTIACPLHPLTTVYFATSGFCVFAMDTASGDCEDDGLPQEASRALRPSAATRAALHSFPRLGSRSFPCD